MAQQKIVENVPRDLVLGEVVLTGGGALLAGIDGNRRRRLRASRLAWAPPTSIGGLTDAMSTPQYATAIGLVLFGANGRGEDGGPTGGVAPSDRRRIQRWFADLWN